MNISVREAILKTADLFEREPELFDYWETQAPPDCGTPGCALGYIGFFMGHAGEFTCDLGRRLLDVSGAADSAFYRRLASLVDGDWTRNAELCAKALRLYADRYHPEQKVLTVYRPGADIVREFLQEVA